MTLAEKLGQLEMSGPTGPNGTPGQTLLSEVRNGTVGSVLDLVGVSYINQVQRAAMQSRLHIPVIFGLDVIHGYKTIFPVPLAEASSWDPAAVRNDASISASEATADGIKWTFNPMVDIRAATSARRTRWPRPSSISEGMARCRPVMSAFTSLDGVPDTANPYLLTTILREEWHFGGTVVSDYQAIQELEDFGYATSGEQAAQLALTAGVDIEMGVQVPSQYSTYTLYGPDLVKTAKISMATINNDVRHVLTLKFLAGLFAHPFTDPNRVKTAELTPANLAAARAMAGKSMVLLNNKSHALPLNPSVPSIAVTYAQGCDAYCTSTAGFGAAVSAAKTAAVTVVVAGEPAAYTGEASSRSNISLPGQQTALIQAIAATGKPYVVVLMNGRPLTLGWVADNAPALLEAWFPGTEGGNAVADVLFGKVDPGGKLPMSFPRDVGQIPISYNELPTGRPYDPNNKYTSKYLDVANTPRYPFGYGLSYTTFALSNLHVSASSVPITGTLTVSADITNTGPVAGDDVVQLYTHVGFYNNLGQFEVDPGTVNVYVGDSSTGGLRGQFTVS